MLKMPCVSVFAKRYFLQLFMRSEDFPAFLSILDKIDCSGSSTGLKFI